MADDNVQHGIDDNPSGDPAKGAALGGLGGAAVGAAAGSLAGPVGTVIGAAVGAISGAVASGAAVAAVDAVDNDDTVSGVGGGSTGGGSTGGASSGTHVHADGTVHSNASHTSGGIGETNMTGTSGEGGGHNVVTGGEAETDAGKGGLATGALAGGTIGAAVGGPVGAVVGGVVGSLAGGVAGDASEADDTTGTTGGTGAYGSGSYGGTVSSGPLQDDLGVVAGGAGNLQTTDRDVTRVPVVEEQLNVGKEMREAGEVQVTKHIVEEQVNVPVTVQREEVVVTRHDVDRAVSSTDLSGDVLQDGETIRVPVREEVPVVSKEARVTGEVEIAKTSVTEQQTVSDTVRREEVDIDDNTRTHGSTGTGSI